MRRTKIVGTIGPISRDKKSLTKLVEAGLNVVRLNFSHDTHENHIGTYNTLQEINKELGTYVGTLLDTKGPEIRVDYFENGGALIEKDSIVNIHMKKITGDCHNFSITFSKLFDDVNIDDRILVDDGFLQLIVIDKNESEKIIITKARNTHYLKDRKGINIPGVKTSMPFLSANDKKDIQVAIDYDFDYIALSFVRTAKDVLQVRKLLEEHGKGYIQIVSKIESQEALDNIDEIIEASDGIMVARGDLGVEILEEDLPHTQKMLCRKSQKAGKFCIVATHMLESMQENPRPTRAEVSDVANAVYDGCDATMLSGETSVGKYAKEAVINMAKINDRSEDFVDHQVFVSEPLRSDYNDEKLEAISYGAIQSADNYDIKAIVTYGFKMSDNISKYRPKSPIIAVVDSYHKATAMSVFYGVYPVTNEKECQEMFKKLNINKGDTVLVVRKYQSEFKTV